MFHKGHHQISTSHYLTDLSLQKTKSCCKTKSKSCNTDDKNRKDHSSDDGCGDECHCACCAKVLIYNLHTAEQGEIAIADFINEEKLSSDTMYSFDYSHNIVHPPTI